MSIVRRAHMFDAVHNYKKHSLFLAFRCLQFRNILQQPFVPFVYTQKITTTTISSGATIGDSNISARERRTQVPRTRLHEFNAQTKSPIERGAGSFVLAYKLVCPYCNNKSSKQAMVSICYATTMPVLTCSLNKLRHYNTSNQMDLVGRSKPSKLRPMNELGRRTRWCYARSFALSLRLRLRLSFIHQIVDLLPLLRPPSSSSSSSS